MGSVTIQVGGLVEKAARVIARTAVGAGLAKAQVEAVASAFGEAVEENLHRAIRAEAERDEWKDAAMKACLVRDEAQQRAADATGARGRLVDLYEEALSRTQRERDTFESEVIELRVKVSNLLVDGRRFDDRLGRLKAERDRARIALRDTMMILADNDCCNGCDTDARNEHGHAGHSPTCGYTLALADEATS